MPVVQTAMRVPGGDAVQRVYGVPAATSARSRSSRSRTSRRRRSSSRSSCGARARVDLAGATASTSTAGALCARARPPSRWAVAADGTHRGARVERARVRRAVRAARVTGRRASSRRFLYPVAHRTTLRAVASPLGTRGLGAVDPLALPDAAAVARVGARSSTAGCRSRCPTSRCRRAVDAARAATVLAPARRGRSIRWSVAALEDWGLDAEAAAAWTPPHRARPAAARPTKRAGPDASWDAVWSSRGAAGCRRCSPRCGARARPRRPTTGVALLAELAAGVERAAVRRARRADPARPGVVLGPLARRPTRVALGRPRRCTRSPRPALDPVVVRPTNRAARRCSPHRLRAPVSVRVRRRRRAA